MKSMRILFALTALTFGLALTMSSVAMAQESGAVGRKDALETTRAEVQANRKARVEENLDLTDAEAKAFWPLYDEYRAAMIKVGDRRAALITDFARNYEKLTDEQATNMVKEMLDIQEQEISVRREHLTKMGKVLPPQKLARFAQIENKFDAMVNSKLTEMIPLAETK